VRDRLTDRARLTWLHPYTIKPLIQLGGHHAAILYSPYGRHEVMRTTPYREVGRTLQAHESAATSVSTST